MSATKLGWLALALTSGCLRFGYDAKYAGPDASQRDDAGVRRLDGGTRDAAVSSKGGTGGAVSDAAGSGGSGAAGRAGSAGQANAGAGAGGDVGAYAGSDAGSGAGADASAGAGADASAGAGADAGAGQAGSTAGADAGVDVNQMLAGTDLRVQDILGFYSSPSWGDMVLQAQGAEIWGVYAHDGGTIIGAVTSDGVFSGWWSQLPSRDGTDAGEVEFSWSVVNGTTIHLDGRWRYQTSGLWLENWDLDLVTDRSPPSSLTDVFNYPEEFRRHP